MKIPWSCNETLAPECFNHLNGSSKTQSFKNLTLYNANHRWLHISRNSKHTILTVYGKKITLYVILVWTTFLFFLITSSSLIWETETLLSPHEAVCPQLRTGASYLSPSTCWHNTRTQNPLMVRWLSFLDNSWGYFCARSSLRGTTALAKSPSEKALWWL